MKSKFDSDDLFTAYVVAALWSSTDDSGDALDDKYSIDDLSPDAAASMMSDCEKFTRANEADLVLSGRGAEQIGHDFWLTRNGHGAGFWDRGLGDVGDRLTKAAQAFPEIDLYVGDDGKIYA